MHKDSINMVLARFIFSLMLILVHAGGSTCTIHHGMMIIDPTGVEVYGNNLLTLEKFQEIKSKTGRRLNRKMKLRISGKKESIKEESEATILGVKSKVKMGGFNDFSADYHVPKYHPPRNN